MRRDRRVWERERRTKQGVFSGSVGCSSATLSSKVRSPATGSGPSSLRSRLGMGSGPRCPAARAARLAPPWSWLWEPSLWTFPKGGVHGGVGIQPGATLGLDRPVFSFLASRGRGRRHRGQTSRSGANRNTYYFAARHSRPAREDSTLSTWCRHCSTTLAHTSQRKAVSQRLPHFCTPAHCVQRLHFCAMGFESCRRTS
jgi:hypothetical protein